MSTLLNRPISSLTRPGAPALTDVIPLARSNAVVGITYGDIVAALDLLYAPVGGGGGSGVSVSPMAMNGEDAEPVFPVPGPAGAGGAQGSTGAQGNMGPPGSDGPAGEDVFPQPGPQGLIGAQGQTGMPGLDGMDAEPDFPIPGPQGATGAQGPPGGGSSMVTGTTTIDFGAFPGSLYATVDVGSQAAIVAGSIVEAWIRPVATADHLADEHIVDPPELVAADIVAGSKFTIHGRSNNHLRHHGLYTIAWAWV